jgi:hypothetical protein
MTLISGRAEIKEASGDLFLTGDDIKSKDRGIAFQMRKDTDVHHPQLLGFSGVYDVDMSSTISIRSPHPINPTGTIELIHPFLLDFCTRALKLIL